MAEPCLVHPLPQESSNRDSKVEGLAPEPLVLRGGETHVHPHPIILSATFWRHGATVPWYQIADKIDFNIKRFQIRGRYQVTAARVARRVSTSCLRSESEVSAGGRTQSVECVQGYNPLPGHDPDRCRPIFKTPDDANLDAGTLATDSPLGLAEVACDARRSEPVGRYAFLNAGWRADALPRFAGYPSRNKCPMGSRSTTNGSRYRNV